VPFSPWWQFLLAGGDGVREDMPSERKASKGNTKLPGAYLDGIDAFDAAFFGTYIYI
jgi:acyl transferase domain-containing protein